MDLLQKRKQKPSTNKAVMEDMTKTLQPVIQPAEKPLVDWGGVGQGTKVLQETSGNNYLNNKLSIVLAKLKK
jgi:hypothetical protein